MIINWYPGHMKKTHGLISDNLKLVDCVVELLDARLPYSSRNPVFDGLVADKPRVVALNKSDLTDPKAMRQWIDYYKEKGISAIPIDALHGKGIPALLSAVKDASHALYEKLERQNRKERAIRMMIIGIPNVGKSSLINALTGTQAAKVGNKPGVTKGKQWIRVREDIELFDTPGILWPKIDDTYVGLNLAYSGSIRDEILVIEDVALYFLRDMLPRYGTLIAERYKIDLEGLEPAQVMEAIALKRGCIFSKDNVDYNRVARLILDEFRKGVIGQLCLETPETVAQHTEEQALARAELLAQKAAEGAAFRAETKGKARGKAKGTAKERAKERAAAKDKGESKDKASAGAKDKGKGTSGSKSKSAPGAKSTQATKSTQGTKNTQSAKGTKGPSKR